MSEIRQLVPAATDPLDDDAIAAAYGLPGGVRMNFVTSLDGAVAVDGYSAGLSGPADKRLFGLLRMLSDAVLVAAGTLRHEGYRALRLDEPRRAWRRAHGLPEYPALVVVSNALALDPDQAAFAGAPVRPIILTAEAAPADRRAALTPVADVLPVGPGVVDLAAGLGALRERGLARLLCEGGPLLFGSLTAAGLVDELCLTVSPLLAGPGAGRITAGPVTNAPVPLRLAHVLAAADTLFLHYTR
ncbi:pyrimidine reductase family protein [Rhizomonospora bruguierae]|uniref:pyrimidine reductase family protein n=1 Tax=Rhizomonospora bruguierae TaxID=1581705 RepID=UPI0020BE86B7|nr:pyrimidine reductase family protein [Micromonospora sp. NBRC 107566]